MELISKVHGKIEYNEENIVTFDKGLAGFNDLHKYVLVDLDNNEPFKLLHSLEDDEIGFIVVSPYLVMKDYELKLDKKVCSDLKIEDIKDVFVVTTVTLNSDIKKITTNLRGPIIVNSINGLAEQLFLDNPKYPSKYCIIQEA